MASLVVSGGKERLSKQLIPFLNEKIGFFHQWFMRWCIKTTSGICVGFAGLACAIPIIGPILTALLSGWVVTWDLVYIPLMGMGKVGIFSQARSVLANFGDYYWFGFWAVLIEEIQIPIVGPICHVYNVYSAAFFLERMYLKNTTPVAFSSSYFGGTEL